MTAGRSPTVRVGEAGTGRVIVLESPRGSAQVHEFGAHVTSWTPADGRGDVLFVSRRAHLDGSAAIRGGVPVIFPQFGPGPLPKHGFARTARWRLDDAGVDGDTPFARLVLADDDATRATWPHAFAIVLTVRVDDALTLVLDVANTGAAPLHFTGALHTYLRVADVTHARVLGLAGRPMRDQLTRVEATEGDGPLVIDGPVDRVYPGATGPLRVYDGLTHRTVRVETAGFTDTVLWNPWEEGARVLDDLGDEEWRTMLCLEPALVASPVELAAGERWQGVQRLVVES